MAHYTFTAADGMLWEVWDVIPRGPDAMGVTMEGAAASLGAARHVAPALRAGWLAFRRPADGALRRLAPIPSGWEGAPPEQLARLCALASPAKPHRG